MYNLTVSMYKTSVAELSTLVLAWRLNVSNASTCFAVCCLFKHSLLV